MATLSKRRVAKVLIELAESGVSTKKLAQILAILSDGNTKNNSDLYMRDIRSELEEKMGVVVAEVTTAKKITPTLEKKVIHMIREQTGARTVEIVNKVDPSIIGGIIVTSANYELDGSVRTKFKKLNAGKELL